MEKKMETKQTNEVMHVAAEGPRHDVPTGWPERLRTDEAIKLAYALEAAGYLNEDWKPAAELSKGKILYVANLFRDPHWRPSVYPLFEYWGYSPIGAKAVKDDNFKSEIKAIIKNLREEEKAEKMAHAYCPKNNYSADSKSYRDRATSCPDNAYEYMERSVTVGTVQDFQERVEDFILDTIKEDKRWNEFIHSMCVTAISMSKNYPFFQPDSAEIVEAVVLNVESFLSDILVKVAENVAWDLWESPILGDDNEE